MRYIKAYRIFEANYYDDAYDIFIPVMDFGLEMVDIDAKDINKYDTFLIRLKNNEFKYNSDFINILKESIDHIENKYNFNLNCFRVEKDVNLDILKNISDLDKFLLNSNIQEIKRIKYIDITFK